MSITIWLQDMGIVVDVGVGVYRMPSINHSRYFAINKCFILFLVVKFSIRIRESHLIALGGAKIALCV